MKQFSLRNQSDRKRIGKVQGGRREEQKQYRRLEGFKNCRCVLPQPKSRDVCVIVGCLIEEKRQHIDA